FEKQFGRGCTVQFMPQHGRFGGVQEGVFGMLLGSGEVPRQAVEVVKASGQLQRYELRGVRRAEARHRGLHAVKYGDGRPFPGAGRGCPAARQAAGVSRVSAPPPAIDDTDPGTSPAAELPMRFPEAAPSPAGAVEVRARTWRSCTYSDVPRARRDASA